MAHSQETRDKVRQLYIEGMSLKSAAVTCGVSYDTARDWKANAKLNGDDWDTARTAYRVSDQGIDDLNKQMVEQIARQIITTTREIENSTIPPQDKATLLAGLTDAYSKFAKGFARVNPAYSGLSVALDTLKVIAEYLKKEDPAALRALHPHLDELGAILGRRHG